MSFGITSGTTSPSDTKVLSQGRAVSTAGAAVELMATIPVATLGNKTLTIELFFDQVSGVGGATTFGICKENNAFSADAWTKSSQAAGYMKFSLRQTTSMLTATQCDVATQTLIAVSNAFEQDSFDFTAAENIYVLIQQVAAKTYAIRWIATVTDADIKV